LAVESVRVFAWNGCAFSRGITALFQAESMRVFAWNLQDTITYLDLLATLAAHFEGCAAAPEDKNR